MPKLKSSSASSVSAQLDSQFYRSLCGLLDQLGCFRHPGVVLDTRDLDAYDWRAMDSRIKLVYSVPGYFDVDDPRAGGMLMLNEAVREMKLRIDDKGTIEYQVKKGKYPYILLLPSLL